MSKINEFTGTGCGLTNIFKASISALAICTTLLTNTALAADPIADPNTVENIPIVEEDSGWKFAVDPLYSWLPGLNGDIRVFGHEASVDITTLDILSNLKSFIHALDGLYMGSGEMRKGNFGLQYDIVYLALGGAADFTVGPVSGGVDLGSKVAMTTLAANYRFHETPTSSLDVIAGIRITDIQTNLTLSLGPTISVTDGDTWVDPVIGIRGKYDLNEHMYLKVSALYGGFGVSSKSLYDVAAFVGYELANGMELYGGWRIADTNYNNGSFKWDVTMSGPMMGLTLKF